MKPLSIFLIVTFAVLIVVFVVLTVKKRSGNQTRHDANVIIPFAGYLSPPNAKALPNPNNVGTASTPQGGLFLVGMGNGLTNDYPQIQCPVGTHINIIGAYVETNDPFGECYGNSTPAFNVACGNRNLSPGTAKTCKVNSDCPQGTVCDETGQCLPNNTCSVHTDCAQPGDAISACSPTVGTTCSVEGQYHPTETVLVCRQGRWMLDPAFGQCMMCDTANSGPGAGVCKNIPLCTNITSSGSSYSNATCSDPNNRCKIRDASAHLAARCDGKTKCLADSTDVWIPSEPNGAFGPLPCDIKADQSDITYQSLPVIPGWNQGSTPAGGGQGKPASFSQGYYVHGIYTCVPDSEVPAPPTTPKS